MIPQPMIQKEPEDCLRQKARLLHQKQEQLRYLNPFGDGTLVQSETYCDQVDRLKDEIARLQNEIIRTKALL